MKRKGNTKLGEWQKNAGNAVCAQCGRKEGITVDHIVPVYIIQQLAISQKGDETDYIYNDEQNFQYLCMLCNRKKASALPVDNPKFYPLMERYLNIAKALWL